MCSRLPRPCAPFFPRLARCPPFLLRLARLLRSRFAAGMADAYKFASLGYRHRYRHPGHVGLHVCFRLLRDRRLHLLQGHRQLLHLRLHRGLALQVVRDDWNKCVMGISEASTTATSLPCASTSPAHSSASAGPATSVTATTAAPCATAATASWASAASRARPTGTSA